MKQLNKSIYILAICMNSSIISTNSSPFRSFSQNKCLLHVTERKKWGRGANHFNNASHDIRITNKPPEASLLLVTNRSSRGRVSTVNYANLRWNHTGCAGPAFPFPAARLDRTALRPGIQTLYTVPGGSLVTRSVTHRSKTTYMTQQGTRTQLEIQWGAAPCMCLQWHQSVRQ